MIQFNPTWLDGQAALPPTVERASYDARLRVASRAAFAAPAGDTSLDVPAGATVASVTVDNRALPFTQTGTGLHFPAPLPAGWMAVTLDTAMTVTLLHGRLPPGLTLTGGGHLTGTVENVPSDTAVTYAFTLRLSDGGRVCDRPFSIAVTPVNETPVWNTRNLPPPLTGNGLDYRLVGTVARGAAFSFTVDANDPDRLPLRYALGPVADLAAPGPVPGPVPGDHDGVLPKGLGFDGTTGTITGVIRPDALVGLYLLAATIDTAPAPPPLVLAIAVTDTLDTRVAPPLEVSWDTPEGHLGSLQEGEASAFAVHARSVSGLPVVYELSPYSPPLPPGLTLDPATGAIAGQPVRPAAPSTTTVTLRARIDTTFAERRFSLTVLPRFAGDSLMNVGLRLPVAVAAPLVRAHRAIIPPDAVYRPGDDDYGIVAQPGLYVLDGLATPMDLYAAMSGTAARPGVATPDHHGPLAFVLGDYRVAVARSNGTGAVLYEVLHRPVIDPQDGAGGFSYATDAVVEDPVVYTKGVAEGTRYVYPASLRNIRHDLCRDLGLAVADPGQRRRLGIDSLEPLPLWMRSRQSDGTVPGYRGAIVAAYLQPGTGAAIARALNASGDVPPQGATIEFDRYHALLDTLSFTRFDTAPTPAVLPIALASGQTRVALGRWAGGIRCVLLRDGLADRPWRAGADYTVTGSAMEFAAAPRARGLLVWSTPARCGEPLANGAASLGIGPCGPAIRAVTVNGRPLAAGAWRLDAAPGTLTLSPAPAAGDEIVLTLDETGFDAADGQRTRFDVMVTREGKYYKIQEVFR